MATSLVSVLWLVSFSLSNGQILNPPYVNIATGKDITATATCGQEVRNELFCKLTGNTGTDYGHSQMNLIQGQYCDVCDPFDPLRSHPITNAIDGTERWWQSPPLSRGIEFNQVNVTIDLGQEYHVAYVLIKAANSPRPGVWALEKSSDYGQTYQVWQYFADTPSDCNYFFGMGSLDPITADDTVICTTEYSKAVPLENGEIIISLINGRPGSNSFSSSEILQAWTKATNIRLRFIRTKSLQGHLMALARRDPTVTRRYYYSIKDISIGGRCVCNGHAEFCDTPSEEDPTKMKCTCVHNTCGDQCGFCCPGYVQNVWKAASIDDANACEKCNCYDHTEECVYDPEVDRRKESINIYGVYQGGGVCINCQHNTEGINCDKCKAGFYRPYGLPLNSTIVCQPCNCDSAFTTGNCAELTGICECKPQYTGDNCDTCSAGYYNFPTCQPCDCNTIGTLSNICEVGGGQCPCRDNYGGLNCDICAPGYHTFPGCIRCTCDPTGSVNMACNPTTGKCTCLENFQGQECDQCRQGYFNYPICQPCYCDRQGTHQEVCDARSGVCLCLEAFGGEYCDRCGLGYYGYPSCFECNCDTYGSQHSGCTDTAGQCQCKPNFTGLKCDSCAPGYYNYPQCFACDCSQSGSYGVECNQLTGQCYCLSTFRGQRCDDCAPMYYNYPICEECQCDPAGVIDVPGESLGGCGSHTAGACFCKENVMGRTCNICKPLFWKLQLDNSLGCDPCDCFNPGTLSGMGVCDQGSGQCPCKMYSSNEKCSECVEGTYMLEGSNVFGCQGCDCDVGGAIQGSCDKITGMCACKPNIEGRKCDRPILNHYHSTLHHMKYECEDALTSRGTPARFGFDPFEFPGFSSRGYCIMSSLQTEVKFNVMLDKPSLYRIIIKYKNMNPVQKTGLIVVQPDNEIKGKKGMSQQPLQQQSDVILSSSTQPELVTVSGNGFVTPFLMNPGKWTISITCAQNIFLDYIVLLPAAYYEATILQKEVTEPCKVGVEQEICKIYTYAGVDGMPLAKGVDGYYDFGNQRFPIQTFKDETILQQLNVEAMAFLDRYQPTLTVVYPGLSPGRYTFVVQYYSNQADSGKTATVAVMTDDDTYKGYINIYHCQYLCRSVVLEEDHSLAEFDLMSGLASIEISVADSPYPLAIEYITAVPVDNWHIDYVKPALQCTRGEDGQCLPSIYSIPPGTIKTEAETMAFITQPKNIRLPPNLSDPNVQLYLLEGTSTDIRLLTQLPTIGRFVFVVHVYQPESAGYQADFILHTGIPQEGKFEASFCPGVSGCRYVVTKTDGNSVFELNGFEPDITIRIPQGKTMWLDYILAVPVNEFEEGVLIPLPMDRAVKFIQECGGDNFDVSCSASDFCLGSMFSLVTDYNMGAWPCECNSEGSLSLTCEQCGGQCPCRENIIGRVCNRCMTGYYGFPNCQKCMCPNEICHEVTGDCICPPNVMGTKCDTCAPNTYGYDAYVGCEVCNCHPMGAQKGMMQCDSVTGECLCNTHVSGQYCDQCQPGYHSFPNCLPCDCDLSGTTQEICDQTSAQCICKPNVHGPRCDICIEGTFYLESRNPLGCTNCFCFGTTQICQSSGLPLTKVDTLEGWDLMNFEQGVLVPNDQGSQLLYVGGSGDNPGQAIYFIAPAQYLGNKVTSYGSQLEYTISYSLVGDDGDITVPGPDTFGPDVVLRGNGLNLYYTFPNKPMQDTDTQVTVDLLEGTFKSENGGSVSRANLMAVLANLDLLMIRAQYYEIIQSVTFGPVSFQVTTEDQSDSSALALNAELCHCPPSFTGTSCEECADGYYRIETGLFLGICIPCQCNGHAVTCDSKTGICLDCQHHTVGDHCEQCEAGYAGDPTLGNLFDCQLCACPGPFEDRNFAVSCSITEFGVTVSCECMPGYIGQFCQECDPDYFGDPMSAVVAGCQPCDCTGNNDPNNSGRMCDSSSGQCNLCLPEFGGFYCQECAPGFFGDAKDQKNCLECLCHECGTLDCDNEFGVCQCRPNVVGIYCDLCEMNYWNFDSCMGCLACNCGEAAISLQCDHQTGQCDCQPGVTGLQCDRCSYGHWDYSPFGCQKCDCPDHLGCELLTGRCICPTGMTGEHCEFCLPRHIPVEFGYGCSPCDECIDYLLDDMEEMNALVMDSRGELVNISVGLAALQRLETINSTAWTYLSQLGDIVAPSEDVVEALMNDINELQEQADDLEEKTFPSSMRSREEEEKAAESKASSMEAEKLANDTRDFVYETVARIWELVNQMGSGVQSDSSLVKEAQDIVNRIKLINFEDEKLKADDEYQAAQLVLDRAKNFLSPVTEIVVTLRDMEERAADLQNKFNDAIEKSEMARAISKDTQNLLKTLSDPAYKAMMDQVKGLKAMMEESLKASTDILELAKQYLTNATDAYRNTEIDLGRLDSARMQLEDGVNAILTQLGPLNSLVNSSMEHALNLRAQIDMLESLIIDTLDFGNGALEAQKAYESIVKAINDAVAAANSAKEEAEEALNISNGLSDQADESLKKSQRLDNKALKAKKKVDGELTENLNRSKESVTQLNQLYTEAFNGLQTVNDGVANLAAQDNLGDKALEANKVAEEALALAEKVLKNTVDIDAKIPEYQEKMEKLQNGVKNINDNLKETQPIIDRLKETLPVAINLAETLPKQVADISAIRDSLAANLTELQNKINEARYQASIISVSMKMADDSSVQLPLPENLNDASTYIKTSLFFRTSEENGFLLYMGGPLSSDNNFLGIKLKNGKVVFHYELGTGPATIENDAIVSDGEWHQVIVERVGKAGRVSVLSLTDGGEATTSMNQGNSEGKNNLLELNPETTILYVGGVPDSFELPEIMNEEKHFIGCLQDLSFYDNVVGLWNYLEANQVNEGCTTRDSFTSGESEEGYTFSGEGYVVQERGVFNPFSRTSILFNFRTYASNALIFYAGKDRDFLSIELQDGHIVFQYELGGGPAILRSPEKYNTGEKVSVAATRDGKSGTLTVQGIAVDKQESQGGLTGLSIGDLIYIGGVPDDALPSIQSSQTKITETPFQGCFNDLALNGQSRELSISNNLNFKGIRPGCVDQPLFDVSFSSGTDGYVALPTVSVDRQIDIQFRFRTKQETGLIMYLASEQQNNALSIQMVSGKMIAIMIIASQSTVSVTSEKSYNDGAWHYAALEKNNLRLTLTIDDMDTDTDRSSDTDRRSLSTTSPVYFGGVPNDLQTPFGNTRTSDHFVGCLSFISIRAEIYNFQKREADNAAIFTSCPLDAEVQNTQPFGGGSATTNRIEGGGKKPYKETKPSQGSLGLLEPSVGAAGATSCALPEDADLSILELVTPGQKFGLTPDSRAEFVKLPGKFKLKTLISLDFSTKAENGMIFFMGSHTAEDFLAIYMFDGQIMASFDLGDGILALDSLKKYNDGEKHSIELVRERLSGELKVDGASVDKGVSPAKAAVLNVDTPYYLGGLASPKNASRIQKKARVSFDGCIDNFLVKGKTVGKPDKEIQVQSCNSEDVEQGVYFSSEDSYLVAVPDFKVGLDIQVEFYMKPRRMTAIVMSAQSARGDFLSLELDNGDLVLRANNGEGVFTSVFKPDKAQNYLCNGQWHHVKAIKTKNVAMLYVDNIQGLPGFGNYLALTMDLNNPLYIGGLPAGIQHDGLSTDDSYIGCIRDLSLTGTEVSFREVTEFSGGIHLSGCPTN